jgi:hypothetical protein
MEYHHSPFWMAIQNELTKWSMEGRLTVLSIHGVNQAAMRPEIALLMGQ